MTKRFASVVWVFAIFCLSLGFGLKAAAQTIPGQASVLRKHTNCPTCQPPAPSDIILVPFNTPAITPIRTPTPTCRPDAATDQIVQQFASGLNDRTGPEADASLIGAASLYYSTCVKTVASSQSALGDPTIERVASIIEINGDFKGVICSGVFLTPQIVLTAKHCFAASLPQNSTQTYQLLDQSAIFGDYAVVVAGVEATHYSITAISDANGSSKPPTTGLQGNPTDDLIFLTLAKPAASISSSVELSSAWNQGDYLILAATSPVLDEARPSRPSFVIDKTSKCRIAATQETVDGKPCIIHFCSTEYGDSGAPIWHVDPDGRTRLAGIQLAGSGTGACPTISGANVGAGLSGPIAKLITAVEAKNDSVQAN